MTDYKGFYEAIIDKAEVWERICEVGKVLGLSEHQAALLKVSVQDILATAEEHVPGGYHTEIFDLIRKEGA